MEKPKVEGDPAAKEAARKARYEQWLGYLTYVAKEKICVSCSANRYKKWLSTSHGFTKDCSSFVCGWWGSQL